jgi:hypothetical protein
VEPGRWRALLLVGAQWARSGPSGKRHSLTVIDGAEHCEALQIRVGEKLWVV